MFSGLGFKNLGFLGFGFSICKRPDVPPCLSRQAQHGVMHSVVSFVAWVAQFSVPRKP